MLPTLRQLQYLKLLSEHGSFSRAAEAAHVTQPTLSAGIQELEKILGGPMVDRNRSGVILTAAGAEAVIRAGAILGQAEDLVQACRGAGQPLTGRFRLGVIPTIAPFMLPAAPASPWPGGSGWGSSPPSRRSCCRGRCQRCGPGSRS